MADFVLAIATVKAAYDTYRTKEAATAAAEATLAALVAPTKPEVVLANADWNDYTAALLTYNSSVTTATAAVTTAEGEQRTAELAVIAALGYGSGTTPATICLDEWVKVVGAGAGVLTYTHYIGAATNSTYLTISTTLPTAPFPKITD